MRKGVEIMLCSQGFFTKEDGRSFASMDLEIEGMDEIATLKNERM